jgi:hypothetical protein
MNTKNHEELSLDDLRIVGGGCRKRQDHCGGGHHDNNNGHGGLQITINLNGIAAGNGGCVSPMTSVGDVTVPYVNAVPGAPGDATTTTTTSTTTSLPGAEATSANAPMAAGLGTSLPGV